MSDRSLEGWARIIERSRAKANGVHPVDTTIDEIIATAERVLAIPQIRAERIAARQCVWCGSAESGLAHLADNCEGFAKWDAGCARAD